jgi:hypothetical protein
MRIYWIYFSNLDVTKKCVFYPILRGAGTVAIRVMVGTLNADKIITAFAWFTLIGEYDELIPIHG